MRICSHFNYKFGDNMGKCSHFNYKFGNNTGKCSHFNYNNGNNIDKCSSFNYKLGYNNYGNLITSLGTAWENTPILIKVWELNG